MGKFASLDKMWKVPARPRAERQRYNFSSGVVLFLDRKKKFL
jgi:hypothetical protein